MQTSKLTFKTKKAKKKTEFNGKYMTVKYYTIIARIGIVNLTSAKSKIQAFVAKESSESQYFSK